MPSNKRLSQFCDTMATLLDSGVPISRALRVAGQQATSSGLRQAALNAREQVEGGASLGDALRNQQYFPALFLNLVEAGETSGQTDRVFTELSNYYEFQSQMWRTFLGSLVLPALEYLAAVFVLALVQYIIGMFSDSGGTAAAIWTLVAGYSVPIVAIGLYFGVTRVLSGSRVVHQLLLNIPVLEKVVRSLALARFSLVMHMMMEAGTPVDPALEKACEATGNAVFAARAERARKAIREGAPMTEALDQTGLFPNQYLEILSVAEESGTLSERFDWLAVEHQKQARNYLAGMMTVLSYLIWAMVAGFIIFFIFRFFTRYIGNINRLTGA
mgnify:CR=1 FL=1